MNNDECRDFIVRRLELTRGDALDPHAAAADEWIQQNPQAFSRFCYLADFAHSVHHKIGAKAIVEAMRWEYPTFNKEKGAYKYNNNYTAQIGRRAMELYPYLQATMTTRGKKHG